MIFAIDKIVVKTLLKLDGGWADPSLYQRTTSYRCLPGTSYAADAAEIPEEVSPRANRLV